MVGLFSQIRRAASEMAYNSVLYNWSLRGECPERMVVKPVEPWAGNAESGKIIIEGGLPSGYAGLALHSFVWLRDLRACGSTAARAQARVMIWSWIEQHGRWESGVWDIDICGQRVAMWIGEYEFFAQFSDEASEEDLDFQDDFFESLTRQTRHLSRVLGRGGDVVNGVAALKAIKGLLYAGLAFEGWETYVEQALACLVRQIDAQFLHDGMHRSRNPSQLLEALQIFLDIRGALIVGGYPPVDALERAIERMGRALLFFRNNDRGLGVFNGSQEGNVAYIDAVMAQAGVRGKAPMRLQQGGYEKLQQGRSCIVMDCGRVQDAGFERGAHAGPLAFEMSYGRERLFVNCGTHTGSGEIDKRWHDALRATPAHTTLTIGARNACEIAAHAGFSRKVQKCTVRREEGSHAILVETSHDGYERLNGYVHQRRIYMADEGREIRGEDILSAQLMPQTALDVAIRFHLHPKVMVSLIRGGEEALLRLPGGEGWRFQYGGGEMAASRMVQEDSIYMGASNAPRKSKQLVIYGQVINKKEKFIWRLQKEG